MKIIISDHALKQLAERKITISVVEAALAKPDRVIQQSLIRRKALKLIKKPKKLYLLIVIYDQIGESLLVVTAFITSKLKKNL